ncbi:DUF6255 family natural product biosynthesis protein [Streptomyces rectiverticillatus]|uniref:DUF6255 family natural product biosynthesis protein n=1 Tax=Streptomyces rectiverticillatus TaxID=173860 RepID=UPI003CCC912A
MRRCAHLAGWFRSYGAERCRACGAERHTAYAGLRMPVPDSAPVVAWGCPRLGMPGVRGPSS